MDAVVFTKDCGATTGFNVQVSIVESGADPGDRGNAFISYGQYSRQGIPERGINAWWVGETLWIRYPAEEQVFVKEVSVSGTPVRYLVMPLE
jgi:hypothetical protein